MPRLFYVAVWRNAGRETRPLQGEERGTAKVLTFTATFLTKNIFDCKKLEDYCIETDEVF